jgi:hypothetical protein
MGTIDYYISSKKMRFLLQPPALSAPWSRTVDHATITELLRHTQVAKRNRSTLFSVALHLMHKFILHGINETEESKPPGLAEE